MNRDSIKQILKDHLSQYFPQQELTQWLEPLTFSVDYTTRVISVHFPHELFGRWFMQTMKEIFESHSKPLLQPYAVRYESLLIESSVTASKVHPVEYGPSAESTRFPIAEHTFSSFLFNKKNDFPLAAAKEAVLHALHPKYFPFLIYGQSGSGKTHLLEAMMNELQTTLKGIVYFYGDIFDLLDYWPQYVKKGHHEGKEHVFFIDDAHRIHGTSAPQHDFSHLLDYAQRSGLFFVLAFDALPTEDRHLSTALKHRLTSGLCVKLKKPDMDIRRQYVQHMNEEYALNLNKDDILLLAQRHTDFRSITGALTRIKAYTLLLKQAQPDIEKIIEAQEGGKSLIPQSIIATAAEYFSVNQEDIVGKKRHKDIIFARQASMYLCRELLGLSLIQIGNHFGGLHHSSVLYSLKKIKELQSVNKETNKMLTDLKKLCTK